MKDEKVILISTDVWDGNAPGEIGYKQKSWLGLARSLVNKEKLQMQYLAKKLQNNGQQVLSIQLAPIAGDQPLKEFPIPDEAIKQIKDFAGDSTNVGIYWLSNYTNGRFSGAYDGEVLADLKTN